MVDAHHGSVEDAGTVLLIVLFLVLPLFLRPRTRDYVCAQLSVLRLHCCTYLFDLPLEAHGLSLFNPMRLVYYLALQREIWAFLRLEAARRFEVRCDQRRGLDPSRKDLSAGLPHVDTAATAAAVGRGVCGGLFDCLCGAVLLRLGYQRKASSQSMGGTMEAPPPVVRELVLIGGGHTHVYILKSFGMKPIPGVQLTLVSRDVDTPYSGMLPGHVAGLYEHDECHIDLRRLATFAGARFIHAEVCGIDRAKQTIAFARDEDDAAAVQQQQRPPLAYDVLSINTGSTPAMSLAFDVDDDGGGSDDAVDSAANVATLRVALAKRGLPTSGRKAALVARLRAATTTIKSPASRAAAAGIVPVKPIDGFSTRWDAIRSRVVAKALSRAAARSGGATRLAIVGAGAGGVELALAMQRRLHGEITRSGGDATLVTVTVISRSRTVTPAHSRATQKLFAEILEARGVVVSLGCEVVACGNGELRAADGRVFPYDECIWCTQASAQPWMRDSGLECDSGGFVRVNRFMQSSDRAIFAGGDCACLDGALRPKAGVFAVMAGPALANNLRCALLGRAQPPPAQCVRTEQPAAAAASPLRLLLSCGDGAPRPMPPMVVAPTAWQPYEPQSRFLGIIGTGDPDLAVASKGLMALKGETWLWQLKDWIDRKWMAGYTSGLPLMVATATAAAAAAEDAEENVLETLAAASSSGDALDVLRHAAMRCGGCGAKVGATVLSRVMRELGPLVPHHPSVVVGLDAPDDCALVAPPTGADGSSEGAAAPVLTAHTVDFFRSFVSDPYVFGQVCANHSLSDCHAMCAAATTALAVAVVPHACQKTVGSTLLQMMAGACAALAESGCALVGGHTCEGTELALGFAINGAVARDGSLTKGGLRRGDVLILTKALGTGVLFAADMRMRTRGRWVETALASMVQSNRTSALCLRRHGASACTDVTGFGLLGHLVEMVKATRDESGDEDVMATLDLSRLPLLPGVEHCIRGGIFSSLQPANLRLKHGVANEAEALADPAHATRYPVVFDPQTAGGLLASVPAASAQRCIEALRKIGFASAAVIGEVRSRGPAKWRDDAESAHCVVIERLDGRW